jgi:hypothetical protein
MVLGCCWEDGALRLRGSNGAGEMQQPDANSEERNAPRPLPPRWLVLPAKLDAVCATEVESAPPTQPEQSGTGKAGEVSRPMRSVRFRVGNVLGEELFATEPAQQSLVKLLAQLNERMKTDAEMERCYGAVDRAVAELVDWCSNQRLPGRTGDE